MSWTEDRIEKLTKMWEGGSTASQIADELGGVSRNAVIGKAHRLGLQARPSPVKAAEVEAKLEADVTPEAKAFTVERLAAGAIELRDLIYSAWVHSADPEPPRRNAAAG